MTRSRGEFLAATLDAVVERVAAPEPDADDPWELAVAAFAANERLDQAQGSALARRSLELLTPETDAVVRVAAYGARAFSASTDLLDGTWADVVPGLTPTGDPIADARQWLEHLGDGDDADFARYLLAEAALSCARVGLAAELPVPHPGAFLVRDGDPHPFAVVFTVLSARIAAFHGRIAEAQQVIDGATSAVPLLALLVDATSSLVHGNAAEPQRTRALAERVRTENPRPDTRIAAGCHLLAAYGLIAIEDVRAGAALVLAAGGDADLDRLMITDRAIGLELLVNAALVDDDVDAAEAWAARADELAASPICDASVERTRSRIMFARGATRGAAVAADRAAELALAEGRMIEAAECERLAARAAIAGQDGGAASRRLQAMAEQANSTGHAAAVQAASRELRAAGRRLRPLAGSEWEGLSDREREVARLLLDGLGNAEIASALFLSPHTVRVHVSRVLAAFGVASRFALAAKVPAADGIETSGLTERQRAVVSELSTGAGNAEIARRLGISVKTVEKHLSEIMRRLGVATRVGVLRKAMSPSAPE